MAEFLCLRVENDDSIISSQIFLVNAMVNVEFSFRRKSFAGSQAAMRRAGFNTFGFLLLTLLSLNAASQPIKQQRKYADDINSKITRTSRKPRNKVFPQRVDVQSAFPTRSLSRFIRNDDSPNAVTKLQIDASQMASHPIDPRVFGNFIEHLGGVIYEGLWAQALLNPNLEQIEEKEIAPQNWTLSLNASWISDGYQSPRCVRLESVKKEANSVSVKSIGSAKKDASKGGELSQTVHLPIQRERAYTLKLFLRSPEQPGKVSGKVVVRLVNEADGRTLADAALEVNSAKWKQHTVAMVVREGALDKGMAPRFIVANESGSAVDVDQLTLFPNDNIEGMDPDVIAKSRAWHLPIVRYPGGNFVSGYYWEDGIGKRELRPTRRNDAWGGVEPNHYGTDEFMQFCKLVGTQPQICINAGNGTPEDAANWVRYCNSSDPADRYAALRAANGHPKPYDVKIWEIGNELYGGWQIGHTDPAGNAERYVRFRKAMVAADPTIKLIATGKADEFTPEGWKRCLDWNAAVLRAAVAEGGRAPDYLSLHPLVPLPGLLPGLPYSEQYESAMSQPAFLGETMLPELTRLIAEIAGPNAPTRIAPTEWGIIIGGDKWWLGPNHDVLAGAIFNALTLNTLLRNSDQVTLANMTALLHGGGIKRSNGVVYVDPQYWTQELYAAAQPHLPVAMVTTGPGHDVPARGSLPAVANVPDIDAFAARSKAPKTMVVFVVNRHLTASRAVQLAVRGFLPQRITGTLLSAPDPWARNSYDKPNAVAPRPFAVPAWITGAVWQVTVPPHSLLVLTLQRK